MFRVTPFSITNSAVHYSQSHLTALATLQAQASSGLKYSRPSDSPLATDKIRQLQRDVGSMESSEVQFSNAQHRLNLGVTTLLDIQNLLVRTKQIALDASQSNDVGARETLATEVDALLKQLERFANTKVGDDYLFSGTASDVEPISLLSDSSLAIPSVQYHGAHQRATLSLSSSIIVDTYYRGSEVFFEQQRGETLLFGDTGLASGTGTDSGIGRATISVIHEQTTYTGGSGVAVGLSSPGQDSIIGALGTHVLTVNDTSGTGAFGTISLNGGATVDFVATDTDLQVVDGQGRTVFVDTTNITPGFSGDVQIQADGSLSIDDGVTKIPIDFTSGQDVTHSLTGQVTHVDSTSVHRTGEEHVEYTGSADIFTTLIELRDDLRNTRGMDEKRIAQAFERRLVDIERASENVLEIVGEQSSSLSNIDQLKSRQEAFVLEVKQNLVDLEAADMAEVITAMQSRQTLLQFSFAAYSIASNSSILNFLG